MRQLPATITVPEMNLTIVHAGLVPGKPLEAQSLKAMLNMRNVVPTENAPVSSNSNSGTHAGPSWKASKDTKSGTAWAGEWSGPRHVVFGHDAKRKLQQRSVHFCVFFFLFVCSPSVVCGDGGGFGSAMLFSVDSVLALALALALALVFAKEDRTNNSRFVNSQSCRTGVRVLLTDTKRLTDCAFRECH